MKKNEDTLRDRVLLLEEEQKKATKNSRALALGDLELKAYTDARLDVLSKANNDLVSSNHTILAQNAQICKENETLRAEMSRLKQLVESLLQA